MIKTQKLLLVAIIVLGAFFRFTGINWDANNHLHPDERFLTLVTLALKSPQSIQEYFNTSTSTLNPHNIGYDFYVYGTFPIFLIKFLGFLTGNTDYNSITLVGRVVSAFLDTSLIFIIFILSLRLTKNINIGLASAFSYTIFTLPIQLSHFFAVDTYFTLFTILSLLILLKNDKTNTFISGISFGLALASKITALLFVPTVLILIIAKSFSQKTKVISNYIIFAISTLVTFRFANPYLFTGGALPTGVNQKVIANLQQLKALNDPSGWFPPAVQWINIHKGLFPLENSVLWGLGLGLFICICIGVFVSLRNFKHHFFVNIFLIPIIIIWSYQSLQFAQALRYFYPAYPLLAIFSGICLSKILHRLSFLSCSLFIGILLVWPLSFLSIYTHPHTRITASSWMLSNIPSGSTVSCEYWDDCLPLRGVAGYHMVELHLYDADSPQKITDLSAKLNTIDYLIMSSNRLYGSISETPKLYPFTSKFYADLFSGKTNFQERITFVSRPNIAIPLIHTCISPSLQRYSDVSPFTCDQSGLTFIDDYADETWTVYDHPKVVIFAKQRK